MITNILIGKADEIDLVRPEVRAMIDREGIYLCGDTAAPEATVVIASVGGVLYSMATDSPLAPDRFKPTVTITGPFRKDVPPAAEPIAETRVLTCVYCGHRYPQDTPAWGDKVLTDHIAQCERHPMRAVIEDRDRLRSALIGMVGENDPAALRQIELFARAQPAPQEEKVIVLNAIHALLKSIEA